ncbi:hypothetical protein BKA83DRAFT_4497977 [Pisolithus microcarpus]|nr:hypothetical protein BKA83DRAFT_4497977 [Pisolithus microcarpus]
MGKDIEGPHEAVHDTKEELNVFLSLEVESVQPSPDDHVIWLGDFNFHHPLWDNDSSTQLFTTGALKKAQLLLDLLEKYDMAMPPKRNPDPAAAEHQELDETR